MPEVMLPRDWPNKFRRTIEIKGKSRVMEFLPGVPVDLKTAEVEALRNDIGPILLPIMRDARNKPRVIREDFDPISTSEARDVAPFAG